MRLVAVWSLGCALALRAPPLRRVAVRGRRSLAAATSDDDEQALREEVLARQQREARRAATAAKRIVVPAYAGTALLALAPSASVHGALAFGSSLSAVPVAWRAFDVVGSGDATVALRAAVCGACAWLLGWLYAAPVLGTTRYGLWFVVPAVAAFAYGALATFPFRRPANVERRSATDFQWLGLAAGLLVAGLVPLAAPFPLATVPSFLGQPFARAHAAWTLVAAAAAAQVAVAPSKTLRNGLYASSALHLLFILLKLALERRDVAALYAGALANPPAAAASLVLYALICLKS